MLQEYLLPLEMRRFTVSDAILKKVKKTIPRIVKSVKADAIARNLIPADFSMLEKCVAESDLIFESSKEDIQVKTEIADRIGKAMKPHAVSGTGSSGLSINTIAECYPEELRSRFSASICSTRRIPFSFAS